ncbi:MAG: glycerol-3-phosphate 1-O-acyltransferase PlsY [Phycisphaerales bacterium]|nr:glycerol-3-phosphate 1-O-acyltransferase PlsY [Phycisphaerales bacterium]
MNWFTRADRLKITAMTASQWIILLLIPAYLFGSIPTGFLVARSKGIDIRKVGSGNIGATNVGRALGGRYFALVFILDVIKGALPVAVAGWLLHHQSQQWQHYLLWLLIGAAVLLGNMFSIYLKFKGGKGVATSVGITLGIFPYFTFPMLLAVTTFLVVFKVWRYISLASLVSAALFPIFYLLLAQWRGWDAFGTQLPLFIFGSLAMLLIIWRHRANMIRLIKGTENRAR